MLTVVTKVKPRIGSDIALDNKIDSFVVVTEIFRRILSDGGVMLFVHMPVRIYVTKRIVPNVNVFVECLWIGYISIWQWPRLACLLASEGINGTALKLIQAQESPQRPGVVPCPEVIEAGLIPFFAGELEALNVLMNTFF
jgi:hypothetical protein